MNRNSILIACATNDQEKLIEDHFGEARYFMIYKIGPGQWEHVETIPNRVAGEHDHPDRGRHHHRHGHGEGAKARNILEHFRERKVDVFLSRQFGPNIVIIRQYVLPVVIRNAETLQEGMSLCKMYFPDLVRQLDLPPGERKHLVLTA
ncbi:MAG TPA: hypothetical protein ENK25_05715 [Bacteroidetes bacterium]|nr:hypothetical protein [Bacteroidota bacterium]